MSIRNFRLAILTALLTFGLSLARAQGLAEYSYSDSLRQDREGLAQRRFGRISYSARGGNRRTAGAVRSRSYPGGATDAAREFLKENSMGGAVDQALKLGENTVVRTRQEAGGIPIYGSEVALLVGPGNDVLAFQGNAAAVPVNSDWAVNEGAARVRIRQRFPGASAAGEIPLEARYLFQDSVAEPYWHAVVTSEKPSGEWSVWVSARTGEIEKVESLRWGQAQGYAFPTNPVKGPVTQVTLDNLTSTSNLTGVNAKIYSYLPNLLFLRQARIYEQVATPVGGNYLYSPTNNRFSEVQLYQATDRAAVRFRALGFNGFGRPLEGVVLFKDFVQGQGVYVGQNNAYFSPVEFSNRGGLFFYLTPRNLDTAWDSDVIFHEYTHAVVNALVGRNQGTTFRAINEGTADYFAASFLDDPDMAEWAARIFGERLPYLRTTNNSNQWPRNLVGEEHVDGNIWSGSLWDLRKALGAERANRIILNAVAIMPATAEFFDAAVAVVTSASSLYGESAGHTAAGIMIARGVGSDDAETASNAIALRSGTGVPSRVSAAPASTELLGAQQFRITVPNQAEGLRVQVSASGNVRFYLRYRVPIGFQDGKFQYEQFTATAGTSLSGTLTLSNTPELQSGTYYIGITNLTTQAVTYTVTATVTGGSASAPPAATVLSNGQRATGSAPAGPFLASRQFAIDVPAGATSLNVALSGNRDVDLYVTREFPVFLNSQGFPEADFVSATDASNETLTITPRSLPNNLQPGRYYIGVLNYESATASYSVTATVASTALPPPQSQSLNPDSPAIITAQAFTQSGGVGTLLPQQFSLSVPADTISMRITVNTRLDLDVIVKRGSAYTIGGSSDYLFVPTASEPALDINADSSPALQAGTYFVAFGNYSGAGGTVSLSYSLTRRQAGGGQITSAGVVSAASFLGGGVAPGEIITIFGSAIGPPNLVGLQVANGRVTTQLAQTRVLFDGVASPLIYVSAGQVSCVVPYSVGGKSTVEMIVEFQGRSSNSATLPVLAAKPAIFTANSSGVGQGAILNQNGTVNTTANAAARDSVVVLYATGEGLTNPPGVDGQLANSVFPKPVGAVSVTIGGLNAAVQYAGAAPGLVAGVFQVNVQVPAGVSPGLAVPVQIRVGNAVSRAGVTLAVR